MKKILCLSSFLALCSVNADVPELNYNSPAAIQIPHNSNWSFFADASFTYWYLAQEGLEIATNGVLNGINLSPAIETSAYFPSFKYKPGFKVGIGTICPHDWEYRADYTWIHSNISTSGLQAANGGNLPAGSTTLSSGTSVFVVNGWFVQSSTAGQSLAGSSMSADWTLHMNVIDVTGGRPFYQGETLTISPRGGLEATIITQSLDVGLTEISPQVSNLPSQPIYSYNSSHSWGIGFVGGGTSTQFLPKSFYLEETAKFALLYTTYTSVKHKEDVASTAFNSGPYTLNYDNYYALRPNASLDLGLGWGRYLKQNTVHVDLRLSYEFAIYWGQNMMRTLLDSMITGTGAASNNLFTQGGTFTAMVNF